MWTHFHILAWMKGWGDVLTGCLCLCICIWGGVIISVFPSSFHVLWWTVSRSPCQVPDAFKVFLSPPCAVPHWLSMHVKGRGMGKWAGLPDGGGGWSDRSAVPCSAREKRGGRRESEREGAEKHQKGCVRRSHVGGVESCETARSPEVSVRLRWKIFWMCRCIRSSNGAAGVPGLCWRHRVEPDKQAVSETSCRSDGPDVVMFG